MKYIKCVVFDVDDTLLYTFKNGFEKVNYVARKLQRSELKIEEFRKLYGSFSFEECISKWFPGIDVKLFISNYEKASSIYEYKAICDFSIIQEKLEKIGIKNAILTNGKGDCKLYKKLEVAKTNINRVSCIYTRENCGEVKPSGVGLTKIAAQLKINEEEILYIGDMYSDYMAAYNAGTKFVGVRSGGYIWQDNTNFNVINSVCEIDRILDEQLH